MIEKIDLYNAQLVIRKDEHGFFLRFKDEKKYGYQALNINGKFHDCVDAENIDKWIDFTSFKSQRKLIQMFKDNYKNFRLTKFDH